MYGFITQKMAGVRGVRRSRLFGKSGKHGYLKGQIALTNPFKRIATRYNSLLAYRANADYVYEGPKFTKRHAEGAVKDAKAVLAKLNDFEDEDFKNLRGPKGE